ncbi:MAG: hypothetical protein RLZZ450_6585, partial [Pseudomonadota bacterium]
AVEAGQGAIRCDDCVDVVVGAVAEGGLPLCWIDDSD